MPDDLQSFQEIVFAKLLILLDPPCCLCLQIPIQILHNVFNH